MYKEILQSIDNIQVWPVVSFVIFFLFFIFLIWWALTVDKNFVRHMSELPLTGDNDSQTSKTSSL